MEKELDLNKIRIDGGTQSRVAIDDETVMDYAQTIDAGQELPAIEVTFDGSDYWLVDGFHRYHAHRIMHRTKISAVVIPGTKRDAVLRAAAANAKHGLRRTPADKRKAVLTLLNDPNWSEWSDRRIAAHCSVSHTFVSNLRAALNEETKGASSGNVATGGEVATKERGSESDVPAAGDGTKSSRTSEAKSDEQQGGNVATLVPASRVEELERELAQARREIEMLRRELEAATLDNEFLSRQIDADDRLREIARQNEDLRRENADLRARIDGLLAEKNAAVRVAKRAQRIAAAG